MSAGKTPLDKLWFIVNEEVWIYAKTLALNSSEIAVGIEFGCVRRANRCSGGELAIGAGRCASKQAGIHPPIDPHFAIHNSAEAIFQSEWEREGGG